MIYEGNQAGKTRFGSMRAQRHEESPTISLDPIAATSTWAGLKDNLHHELPQDDVLKIQRSNASQVLWKRPSLAKGRSVRGPHTHHSHVLSAQTTVNTRTAAQLPSHSRHDGMLRRRLFSPK
jgi:hypothetical protein